MPVVPACSRPRQEDGKFKVNLGYILWPSLGDGKMAQPVKIFATGQTIWVLIQYLYGRRNYSSRLSSDILTCTMAHTHTHNNVFKLKKKAEISEEEKKNINNTKKIFSCQAVVFMDKGSMPLILVLQRQRQESFWVHGQPGLQSPGHSGVLRLCLKKEKELRIDILIRT